MLRILTLNIWHDSGPWKERAERIREWIARLDPDVIGFQEVLRGPGFDQAAELLSDRPYHLDYVRASPFWREGSNLEFGNAIASRWPIVSRDELVLPNRGDGETRAALTVGIEAPLPGGLLSLTCTHLHWRLHHGPTRERQVVALCDQVLRLRPSGGFPPVVVGDFNAEPDSDEIRYMAGLHSIDGRAVHFRDAWRVAGDSSLEGERGRGITWSNRNPYARSAHEPPRRIDYIFAGYPLADGVGRVEHCRVACDDERGGVWPSDHFGLYAELRTEPHTSGGPAGK